MRRKEITTLNLFSQLPPPPTCLLSRSKMHVFLPMKLPNLWLYCDNWTTLSEIINNKSFKRREIMGYGTFCAWNLQYLIHIAKFRRTTGEREDQVSAANAFFCIAQHHRRVGNSSSASTSKSAESHTRTHQNSTETHHHFHKVQCGILRSISRWPLDRFQCDSSGGFTVDSDG